MCKTLSPSSGLPFTSYVKISSSKAVDQRNSPLESCLRQLRSFVVRDVFVKAALKLFAYSCMYVSYKEY